MSDDRWGRIQEIFHAALQRSPQERSSYLDEACAGEPELRREVESLLEETADFDSFMEHPAGGLSLAALDAARPSLEGRVLNHYRVGPLIGAGGMAEVYRARDTRLQRDVAIKVLHDVRVLDAKRLETIYREARLLASLNHPNIGAIYGIEEGPDVCGLVLELIEGQTLAERVREKSFSVREALQIAKQIAAGLQAAHAKGIIHRDLKPANIKIKPDGTVKIVDFGVAKLLRSLTSGEESPLDMSTHGILLGTVAYMSPEQARGRSIDVRTDIWAFGCVLYEILAGKPAFQGETPTDIIVKIATEEPDWHRIAKLPESVSHEVERLIRKCLQKNADARYQSVPEVTSDLNSLEQAPTAPVPPEPQDEPVIPVRFAHSVFLLAQIGYLALYSATMYYLDSVARILAADFQIPEPVGLTATLILAMCGIAIRVYLLSAVGWRHPAAGRKFTILFPLLLAFDGIWAASPLLLARRIGYGPALTAAALLAYVPFAQRTLMRAIYPIRAATKS